MNEGTTAVDRGASGTAATALNWPAGRTSSWPTSTGGWRRRGGDEALDGAPRALRRHPRRRRRRPRRRRRRSAQIDVLMNCAASQCWGHLTGWRWPVGADPPGGRPRPVRGGAGVRARHGWRAGYVVNTASVAGVAYRWDAAPYITSVRGLRPLRAPGRCDRWASACRCYAPGWSTNLGETASRRRARGSWASGRTSAGDGRLGGAADEVGPMVCDAIADERFAIFTNADDAERFTW